LNVALVQLDTHRTHETDQQTTHASTTYWYTPAQTDTLTHYVITGYNATLQENGNSNPKVYIYMWYENTRHKNRSQQQSLMSLEHSLVVNIPASENALSATTIVSQRKLSTDTYYNQQQPCVPELSNNNKVLFMRKIII